MSGQYVIGRTLGARLLEWHGGQWSGLYSLGSTAYAGRTVTREQIDAGLVELERCSTDHNHVGRADRRRLLQMIRLLQSKLAIGPIDGPECPICHGEAARHSGAVCPECDG
jgi:hypothetical protein